LPDLRTVLEEFPRRHIAVVGDLMLDEYLWGHIERISPEAPVPILNLTRRNSTLGGAGNVAENLRYWRVAVTFIGIVGADETGRQLIDLLRTHGMDVRGVIEDPGRKSTRKTRLMSEEHGQQVFRLDEESVAEIDGAVEERVICSLETMNHSIEAILCSDYRKGALSEKVLAAVFSVARKRGIRAVVAPKDAKAEKYRGANILMLNLLELKQLAGKVASGDTWLDDSAKGLMERLSLEALVVTRGSEGMSLFESSTTGVRRSNIAATARGVYDVTGAGDTAIAAFTAATTSGANFADAALLANLCAGVKVGKRGTASVSLEEIRAALSEV
jgi:D-beta-D-heptose 7-phosphate kinase / D-beta-D-heptose 1-phosphate adenosyltransferase